MATLAGMQIFPAPARGVMDVDLQDPPELITPWLAKWREGFDVVYAQRFANREGENFLKTRCLVGSATA